MSDILLLLEHRGNRRLLAEALSPRHNVILPESDNALDGSFDLGVVDGISLDRLGKRIQARKRADQPAFLPFLLVTARQDVGMATRHLWKDVDELITSPIEKIELQARVASLLEQRRLSLEFHRALVLASPLAVIAVNEDGVIIEWNPAAERIFGWSESEALGQPFFLLTAEGRRDVARQLFESVWRGEVIADVETQGRKKDGSIIDVAISAAPLRDSHGLATQIVAYVSDISERKRAEEQVEQQLQRLAALHAIDVAISSSLDLQVTLDVFLKHATKQLHVDAAAVLLLKPYLNTLEYAAGHGFRGAGISQLKLKLGEDYAGQAALERRLVSIPDLKAAERPLSKAHLTECEDFVSYFALPLIAKGQIKGVFEVFHRTAFIPTHEWLEFLETLAAQLAIGIADAQLFEELRRSNADLTLAYETTIEGWSRALDLRDKETEGHTLRVTEMTLRLARAAGMTDDELAHIRRGVLLHDIGKMGVPDQILLKPDKLTDEEWVVMRKHPTYAYELLSPIAYLRGALDIPYCHHEKWDGTGYPRGLKGEQIPLAARLFAVVDVWDALTHERPYREAWSQERAMQYILEQTGKHFDPKAVELFLQMRRQERWEAG